MTALIIILGLILRIVGLRVCSRTAFDKNRDEFGWGFFGFFMPILAMIIIHFKSTLIDWEPPDYYKKPSEPKVDSNPKVIEELTNNETLTQDEIKEKISPKIDIEEIKEPANENIELPEKDLLEIKQEIKTPLNYQDYLTKLELLLKIKELLDNGIFTREEFDKEKQKILENE